jgi:hypothetical protein
MSTIQVVGFSLGTLFFLTGAISYWIVSRPLGENKLSDYKAKVDSNILY